MEKRRMGDIVNLNKARKARAKAQAKAGAAANRSLFGIGKADNARAKAEREKAARKLDQARREPPTS
jgi:hypothetical protein